MKSNLQFTIHQFKLLIDHALYKKSFLFSYQMIRAYHVIGLISDSSRFVSGSRHTCRMAFNLAAFSYIVALIGDAFLIFFAIFHVCVPRETFTVVIHGGESSQGTPL